MLENQLGCNLSTIGQAVEAPGLPKAADATSVGKSQFPEVERTVEEALDLLKYDGDVNDSLTGDFCSGRWKALDVEEWQGNFVTNLRQRPLRPVKVR